ncbi:hypothetical protein KSS87_020496 [Heliosperma pusillum]|nr:hypothetical protein KSS87_020496 [Heliosperma pusillum]
MSFSFTQFQSFFSFIPSLLNPSHIYNLGQKYSKLEDYNLQVYNHHSSLSPTPPNQHIHRLLRRRLSTGFRRIRMRRIRRIIISSRCFCWSQTALLEQCVKMMQLHGQTLETE